MQSEMQGLISAMRDQTTAINALVQSNQQVIALLTDVVASMIDESIDVTGDRYLDGESINHNGS